MRSSHLLSSVRKCLGEKDSGIQMGFVYTGGWFDLLLEKSAICTFLSEEMTSFSTQLGRTPVLAVKKNLVQCYYMIIFNTLNSA